MKFKTPIFLLLAAMASCGIEKPDLVQDNFAFAGTQFKQAFVEMDAARCAEPRQKQELRDKQNLGPLASPRNVEPDGTLHMVISRDWTSGFFPVNFGTCMNIPRMISGKKRRSSKRP